MISVDLWRGMAFVLRFRRIPGAEEAPCGGIGLASKNSGPFWRGRDSVRWISAASAPFLARWNSCAVEILCSEVVFHRTELVARQNGLFF